ncbi:hypothetical protein RvY_08496 [Ramazzottius varieornatus]|uniref:Uncharacterized protein n=1 Tax=Ramazzottius varieornatus TaxID=947166 RepID=A0A1D1V641_RAMVA|nr:hypothetical protein RvY_08496 [Ramazzottius varieornatus]
MSEWFLFRQLQSGYFWASALSVTSRKTKVSNPAVHAGSRRNRTNTTTGLQFATLLSYNDVQVVNLYLLSLELGLFVLADT